MKLINIEKLVTDIENLCKDENLLGDDNSTYIDFGLIIDTISEQEVVEIPDLIVCSYCDAPPCGTNANCVHKNN